MTKPEVPLDWINAPRQERSQKTLEKILDAAEALICEGGLDAVTVPAVVKRAGSSVGSFYARFPDKNALLETLHERACQQTIATADKAFDAALWEGRSLEDIVHGMVAFAVRMFGSRKSIMTAFHRALGSDSGYARRRANNGIELGVRALRLFLAHRDRIGHPHPEAAILMTLRMVTATLEQRNALSAAGVGTTDFEMAMEVDDATLARELERMALSYLMVTPDAKSVRADVHA